MRIHLGASKAESRPLALTIGNFDGVHLGHQAMLHALRTAATSLGLETGVLTFEPHPREFFAQTEAPARLTTLREKLELLQTAGVEHVAVLRFNPALASLSAEAFIEEWLVRRFNTRWLLVGDDFRFGARRCGDFNTLQQAGQHHGFECFALSSILTEGVRVSSSAVRDALAQGQLNLAQALLGRPYSMSGRVIQGQRLGRTLGFPTANLAIQRRTPPLAGIFAVSVVTAHSAQALPGVASLGTRPSVTSAGQWLLEVHLFDCNANLYGQRLHVRFHHKIRDEIQFSSLAELTAQMRQDAQQARAFLASAPDAWTDVPAPTPNDPRPHECRTAP